MEKPRGVSCLITIDGMPLDKQPLISCDPEAGVCGLAQINDIVASYVRRHPESVFIAQVTSGLCHGCRTPYGDHVTPKTN